MINKTKAPTPFKMMGNGMKKIATKIATKITAPLVKEIKMQDMQNKKWKEEGEMMNKKYSGNPTINTTSKKNKEGEIINPTKKDIEEYNKKYTTVKLPVNVKIKK